MTTNPFSVATSVPNERGVFGDARRIRGGFLYRDLEITQPFACTMTYDGWWFRQKISVNGYLAWSQISWLTIRRKVDFTIPAAVAPSEPAARIEIEFGTGLMFRRFRLWIDGQIAYDEIN